MVLKSAGKLRPIARIGAQIALRLKALASANWSSWSKLSGSRVFGQAVSMDGFKGNSTGNYGFYHSMDGFSCNFSHQSVLGRGRFWRGVSAVGLLAGSAIVAAPVHVMFGVGLPVSAAAGLKGPVNSVLRLFWSWNEIQQNQLLHRWVLNSWFGG